MSTVPLIINRIFKDLHLADFLPWNQAYGSFNDYCWSLWQSKQILGHAESWADPHPKEITRCLSTSTINGTKNCSNKALSADVTSKAGHRQCKYVSSSIPCQTHECKTMTRRYCSEPGGEGCMSACCQTWEGSQYVALDIFIKTEKNQMHSSSVEHF